jgi:hypothetical protein
VYPALPLSFPCSSGPSYFPAVTKDKPFANLYYIVELPGVLTYIALTSYSPGQTFDKNEEQYKWLEQQLQKVKKS